MPGDAEGGEVGGGAPQEPGAGGGFLVGVDFGVGQSGVVVDGGVHVFVGDPGAGAGAAALQAVAAVHAPAAAVAESADFLDVDVNEFAGPVAFITPDQLAGGPVEPGQPVQVMAGQHGMNGGGGHAQQRGEPARSAFELDAQGADLCFAFGAGLAGSL